jgi:hypothetical protein
MTAEEIFREVIKSPEIVQFFNIPIEKIAKLDFNEPSEFKEIEIIKSIIRGELNNTDKSSVFTIIQKKIMQL